MFWQRISTSWVLLWTGWRTIGSQKMRENSWLFEWLWSYKEERFSVDMTLQTSFSCFRFGSVCSTVYIVHFPLYTAEGIFAQSIRTQSLRLQTFLLFDSPPTETCSATTDTLVFWAKQLGLILQRQGELDSVLLLCPCAPLWRYIGKRKYSSTYS